MNNKKQKKKEELKAGELEDEEEEEESKQDMNSAEGKTNKTRIWEQRWKDVCRDTK